MSSDANSSAAPLPLDDNSAESNRVMPGARMALMLLLSINLFNYLDRYILSVTLPRIKDEMLLGDHNADQKLGWLTTAFLLSYMITSPIFGWLADRFSRWMLVGFGVILWSVASSESGRASGFVVLLITRMFVGVGEAAYGPAAPTIISDMYPIKHRGTVMSWFYMAIPVGAALGYVWGGLWIGWGHWRWAFYSVMIPGLLLGLLCFRMPEPRKDKSAKVQKKAKLADYVKLLKTPSYTLNCLGMAALTFAIGGISVWMPTYVSKFRNATSEANAGLIFGAITLVTGITATLAGGMVADKLRTKIRGAYFAVSAVGLLLAFPFFLLILVTPFPYAWIFIFLSEFCLFFNTGPSNTALANAAAPSVRATAFALNIFIIHAMGDAISPPIIGAVTDHTGGNMNIGFGLVGVMMLVGAAFWWIGARYLDRDTLLAESAAAT